MEKKKLYYILGGIAVLGIGYYLWNRINKNTKAKKEADAEAEGDLNVVDMPVPTDTNLSKPLQITPIENKVKPPTATLSENPSKSICEVYDLDRISLKSTRNRDNFNVVWIYLMNRPNQTDSGIRKMRNITLTNAGSLNGTYVVDDVFVDAVGKIGAIAVKVLKSVYKPFKDDTSLRYRGKITFQCPQSSSFEGLSGLNQENTIRQKSFAEQVINREDGRMFAGDVYNN